jgi:hypothetical protein
LELISFLDPDVIGEDLLMEASVELLSEGARFKKSNYIEARADLLQSSLVQRDKQKQHISVHRLVQDAILATMDVTKKRYMFDQVVRILWADWPSAMPKPSKEPELPQPKSTGGRLHVGRWPICAAIYPHVLRMHQLWSSILDLSEATNLHFAKLLNEAAWYVCDKKAFFLLSSLTLAGIKKSVDEQRSLMGSSTLLAVFASPQRTQIGILYLQTYISA